MCFFFKQKTAYEMRISDWSSDVCSSDLIDVDDLVALLHRQVDGLAGELVQRAHGRDGGFAHVQAPLHQRAELEQAHAQLVQAVVDEIGRASCRERVCQYV